MFVHMALLTNDEMVVYFFDKDQNKYNYEDDDIHRRMIFASYLGL